MLSSSDHKANTSYKGLMNQAVILSVFLTLVHVNGIEYCESAPLPPTTADTQKTDINSSESPLSFNADRAYTELAELVRRGQRYYGAPMRQEAIHWMSQRLSAAKLEVYEQSFKVIEPRSKIEYSLTNLIARFNPSQTQRVILGSHWDTRLWAEEDHDSHRRNIPITGANDGSSGVSVILEISRQLSLLGLDHIGIDLVLFDGEEFGRPGSNNYCVGSKYLAKHLEELYPQFPPIAVIVIDMVGDNDLSFPPELSSVKNAKALTQLLWREGVKLKLPAFISGLGGGKENHKQSSRPRSRWIIDDHSPFQALHIPATLLIDLDYPHWHTHQDTIDKVSAQSLKQTGLALLSSLKRLDQIVGESKKRTQSTINVAPHNATR